MLQLNGRLTRRSLYCKSALKFRSRIQNFPALFNTGVQLNISTHIVAADSTQPSITSDFHFKDISSNVSVQNIPDSSESQAEPYAIVRRDLVRTFSKLVEQKMREEQLFTYESVAAETESAIKRQQKIEEEQLMEAAGLYSDMFHNLSKMGRGTSLKSVQRQLLQWYEPLIASLFQEIKEIQAGQFSTDRNQYGPYLLLLPVEKMAVITLNTTLNCMLRSGNLGEKLVKIAIEIANMMEAEANMQTVKLGKHIPKWQKRITAEAGANVSRKSLEIFNKNLRRATKEEEWTSAVKVKVGAKLIDLLLKSAQHGDNQPSFLYTKNFYQHGRTHAKRMGYIKLDPKMFEEIVSIPSKDSPLMLPRFLPMLVPPKPWNNRHNSGAYYRMKAPLMKTVSPSQSAAVRRANISSVLESLDYLGQIGWRINPVVYETLSQAWQQRIQIAELPSAEDFPMPEQESCFRPWKVVNAEKKANEEKAKKYRLERARQAAAAGGGGGGGGAHDVEGSNSSTGSISSVASVDSEDAASVGSEVEVIDEDALVFDEKFYKNMCNRVSKKNAELHSLRCDLKIKLNIADRFQGQPLYFPHNMDFRGRAYPIPPNLSHLGSDLCRGIMMFDEGKALGSEGLNWLKLHLANLFGHNKITLQERIEWVDAHMEELRDSVTHPLEGRRWWASAENPFQALAASVEIVNAIDSGDPPSYVCRLPVHQDGSCNGLQHYAGLGRDALGAAAVNLVPHQEPQDVYSNVLDKVVAKVERDALIAEDDADEERALCGRNARLVQEVVNRKVIKQTVMTSVYGVTRIGARAQIEARLKERLYDDASAVITPEDDKKLYDAAQYLAGLTLDSLTEMFQSAKEIMDWLGHCARLVALEGRTMAWVTPLGLPVIQPYRKVHMHTVSTVLQSITLTMHADHLPVSTKKQKTAFPPNFVHSMDASHMMMTCLKMKKKGLTFAAVHDSYWTHPSDVPLMNECLREAFVELYEYPMLEELLQSLQQRFPDVQFPPIPERGDLDIKTVLNSQYFFH